MDAPREMASNEINAEALKVDGDNKYRAKDFKGAIESYTGAIALDPDNSVLYTNRAASYLMVLKFKEVIHSFRID